MYCSVLLLNILLGPVVYAHTKIECCFNFFENSVNEADLEYFKCYNCKNITCKNTKLCMGLYTRLFIYFFIIFYTFLYDWIVVVVE